MLLPAPGTRLARPAIGWRLHWAELGPALLPSSSHMPRRTTQPVVLSEHRHQPSSAYLLPAPRCRGVSRKAATSGKLSPAAVAAVAAWCCLVLAGRGCWRHFTVQHSYVNYRSLTQQGQGQSGAPAWGGQNTMVWYHTLLFYQTIIFNRRGRDNNMCLHKMQMVVGWQWW